MLFLSVYVLPHWFVNCKLISKYNKVKKKDWTYFLGVQFLNVIDILKKPLKQGIQQRRGIILKTNVKGEQVERAAQQYHWCWREVSVYATTSRFMATSLVWAGRWDKTVFRVGGGSKANKLNRRKHVHKFIHSSSNHISQSITDAVKQWNPVSVCQLDANCFHAFFHLAYELSLILSIWIICSVCQRNRPAEEQSDIHTCRTPCCVLDISLLVTYHKIDIAEIYFHWFRYDCYFIIIFPSSP